MYKLLINSTVYLTLNSDHQTYCMSCCAAPIQTEQNTHTHKSQRAPGCEGTWGPSEAACEKNEHGRQPSSIESPEEERRLGLHHREASAHKRERGGAGMERHTQRDRVGQAAESGDGEIQTRKTYPTLIPISEYFVPVKRGCTSQGNPFTTATNILY